MMLTGVESTPLMRQAWHAHIERRRRMMPVQFRATAVLPTTAKRLYMPDQKCVHCDPQRMSSRWRRPGATPAEEARRQAKIDQESKMFGGLPPRINRLLQLAAMEFGVSVKSIRSSDRRARFVRPRHIAMWLLRECLRLSYPDIGRRLGGRDHTTVIHGCRKAAAAMAIDPVLAETVERIKRAIGDEANARSVSKASIVVVAA